MTHHEHPNATLVREGFEAFQKGDTAWMDAHLSDDVIWHIGSNSKWSGAYEGRANVLDFFARQAQAMGEPPSVDIHDILGNDDRVVVLGTASANGPVERRVEYAQIFHVKDGKATEVWGMAENDAAVTHSWTSSPAELTSHGIAIRQKRRRGRRRSRTMPGNPPALSRRCHGR